MRVLADVHFAPPLHCAGAEMTMHAVLRWLADQGHEIRVIVSREPDAAKEDFYEGIPLLRDASRNANTYKWADVVMTHLDNTRAAIDMADRTHRPIVHLVHNAYQLGASGAKTENALAVFNSFNIRRKVDWGGLQVVCHPPVWPEAYKTETTKEAFVGLNMNRGKGGHFFLWLAKLMRDVPFIAVRGAYGEQLTTSPLPNLEWMEHTDDPREVYSRARAVLMPSASETYGRVAVEAAVSGIPVISSPTDGVKEALGEAAIYCPVETAWGDLGPITIGAPKRGGPWTAAIRSMLREKDWEVRSAKTFQAVDGLEGRTRFELARCQDAIERLV